MVRVGGDYGPVYAALVPPTPHPWCSGARFAVPGLLGAGPGLESAKGDIPAIIY